MLITLLILKGHILSGAHQRYLIEALPTITRTDVFRRNAIFCGLKGSSQVLCRFKLVQISPYYLLILTLKVPIMNAAGHVLSMVHYFSFCWFFIH